VILVQIRLVSVNQHGFPIALKLQGAAKVSEIRDDDILAICIALGFARANLPPSPAQVLFQSVAHASAGEEHLLLPSGNYQHTSGDDQK